MWIRGGSMSLLLALGGCHGGASSAPAEEPAATGGEEAAIPAAPAGRVAVATLESAPGESVGGTVTFTEVDGQVQVQANVTGLTPGAHGFHVHEVGDCSAPDFSSAGGHFAPEGNPHGAPTAAAHHTGDLGNIEAGADGTASHTITSPVLTLGEGPSSIIGKAVIVHAGADDLTSQPSGAAGGRVACGVIHEAS
jgi:Cu-Zn family superoxide dismutase